MKHSLEIRPRAKIDLRLHHAWMQKKLSHASAEKWSEGIAARIQSLQYKPAMWPLADEASRVTFELREILFRRGRHVHRILFEIAGDAVIVHRVRHAAQDALSADDF